MSEIFVRSLRIIVVESSYNITYLRFIGKSVVHQVPVVQDKFQMVFNFYFFGNKATGCECFLHQSDQHIKEDHYNVICCDYEKDVKNDFLWTFSFAKELVVPSIKHKVVVDVPESLEHAYVWNSDIIHFLFIDIIKVTLILSDDIENRCEGNNLNHQQKNEISNIKNDLRYVVDQRCCYINQAQKVPILCVEHKNANGL